MPVGEQSLQLLDGSLRVEIADQHDLARGTANLLLVNARDVGDMHFFQAFQSLLDGRIVKDMVLGIGIEGSRQGAKRERLRVRERFLEGLLLVAFEDVEFLLGEARLTQYLTQEIEHGRKLATVLPADVKEPGARQRPALASPGACPAGFPGVRYTRPALMSRLMKLVAGQPAPARTTIAEIGMPPR